MQAIGNDGKGIALQAAARSWRVLIADKTPSQLRLPAVADSEANEFAAVARGKRMHHDCNETLDHQNQFVRKECYESPERSAGGALEGRKCGPRSGVWLATEVKKVGTSEGLLIATARQASASKCSSQHTAIGAFKTFSTTARGRCFGPRL